MFRAALTIVRRASRRPATWFLVWSYRDIISLWARSLTAELRRPGGRDAQRMRELTTVLWGLTKETGFAVRTRLRGVSIEDAAPFGAVPAGVGAEVGDSVVWEVDGGVSPVS